MDTIVPDPNNPQALNRYAYTFNNTHAVYGSHRTPTSVQSRNFPTINHTGYFKCRIQRVKYSASSTSASSTSLSEPSSTEQTLLDDPHSISSSRDGSIGATGSLETQPTQDGGNAPFIVRTRGGSEPTTFSTQSPQAVQNEDGCIGNCRFVLPQLRNTFDPSNPGGNHPYQFETLISNPLDAGMTVTKIDLGFTQTLIPQADPGFGPSVQFTETIEFGLNIPAQIIYEIYGSTGSKSGTFTINFDYERSNGKVPALKPVNIGPVK